MNSISPERLCDIMRRILSIIAGLSVITLLSSCSSGGAGNSSENSSSAPSSSVVPSSSSVLSSGSLVSSSEPEPEKSAPVMVDNTQKVKDAIKINDDVGAYLYIPDTKIDTPVLDSSKNYEKSYEMITAYNNRYEETTENSKKSRKRLSNLNWEKKKLDFLLQAVHI